MVETKEKRKFRDTKVGRFLKEKFPRILDAAAGLTGIEALAYVSDIIEGETIDPTDRLELQRLILEQQRVELDNVVSAREREARVVEALNRPDYAQWVVGVIGLLFSGAIIYTGLFGTIQDREIYFHLLGLIEGAILLSIFNYYFGSAPQHFRKKKSTIDILKNNKP